MGVRGNENRAEEKIKPQTSNSTVIKARNPKQCYLTRQTKE